MATTTSIQCIFFDLDDTLYPPSSGIWQHIGRNINRFMVERIGFPEEHVTRVREQYFLEYGTTLNGLRALHGVDPEEYLNYVHDIPVQEYLSPDPRLQNLLENLPQRKWIFSNADKPYILRVLTALGIADRFNGIIDIFAMEYICKPFPQAYTLALELAGSPRPSTCLLLDDQLRNLEPAKELGMQTGWVKPGNPSSGQPALDSIFDIERAIHRQKE